MFSLTLKRNRSIGGTLRYAGDVIALVDSATDPQVIEPADGLTADDVRAALRDYAGDIEFTSTP